MQAILSPIYQTLAEAETHCRARGRPFITLSYAQGLDGSIARQRGMPLAISGSLSMQMTHALRAAHDAILVGIGTVLADDPQLNVRLVEGENPQPVILDTHLRVPLQSKLLQGEKPPWIVTAGPVDLEKAATLENAGAQLMYFAPDDHERIPLPALLGTLGRKGINCLMVEGGAEVITAFVTEQLVDLVVLTIAPSFIGGLQAIAPGEASFTPVRLQATEYARLGDDLIVWGRLS